MSTAPRKRAAEDDSAGPTTRSAKAPKTDQSPTKARSGKGRGRPKVRAPPPALLYTACTSDPLARQANLGATSFKARALPLHVNLTHTPPVLSDDGAVTLASTDPGFLGTSTLLPSSFATGSYGWKGSKRLTIELQNSDGADEKEKVHVMLTINATVIGSKGAKDDEAEADGEAKEDPAEDGADADAEKAVEKEVEEEVAGDEGKDAEGETNVTNGESKPEAMEEVKEGE
ncbi:hypothetical protein BC628DRAFT_1310712 [Trametes gibbosa]|nr:hypothetical protein BC628DRAFT_1310712 [Trametes gibbosa]